MATPTSARSTSSPRILLVEEYDALAAAIRALLKSFAPRSVVDIARSLGEAETSLDWGGADLIVIDNDPPLHGLTKFIEQLPKRSPASALIVIGEFEGQLRRIRKHRLLPKPYDVGEFREAVHALLGARVAEQKPKTKVEPPKPAAAPPPPVEIVAPPPPLPRPKTGKKIVIVDDTEMLLLFVEDALTIANPQFQIRTAPTGMTGLKEIETLAPDLVVLDYSLPDINGDEVCRRLLANERTARIPIIMMSGHVAEMAACAETFANIVATIAKPFRSDALVPLVQQTLELGLAPQPKPPPRKPAGVKPKAVVETKPPPVVRPKPPEPKPVAAAPPPPPPPLPVRSTTEPAGAERRGRESPAGFVSGDASKSTITPAASASGTEVVLGIYLEVVAMRLTPTLRMGAIRARPSSFTVSLHMSPSTIPADIAFELGATELDANNRVSKLRLVPTRRPYERRATRAAVEVGALNFIPQDSRGQVQLTPNPNASMTMHLLAHLDLAGVELSQTFELGAVVLRNRSQTVRVTLGPEQTGVFCEIAGVRLDQSRRIAEMLLNPLK